MTDASTKERILMVAHELFAEKGLHGVSVREIAKKSDVNVAAINYHFKNKEGLYANTILSSIQKVEDELDQLFQEDESIDPVSYASKVMDYFMENSHELRSIFIMISSSDDAPADMLDRMKEYNGPPGMKSFTKVLKNHYPKASEEDGLWFMRSVIAIIMHKAMVMCNSSMCRSMEEIGITKDTFKEDLERLTTVLLKEFPK